MQHRILSSRTIHEHLLQLQFQPTVQRVQHVRCRAGVGQSVFTRTKHCLPILFNRNVQGPERCERAGGLQNLHHLPDLAAPAENRLHRVQQRAVSPVSRGQHRRAKVGHTRGSRYVPSMRTRDICEGQRQHVRDVQELREHREADGGLLGHRGQAVHGLRRKNTG